MSMSCETAVRRIQSIVYRLRNDCRGLAAVEFALIVPLMLTVVFGTIEITNGVAANRKVYLVSRTLSDLTSRARSVLPADIAGFFTIGAAIMQPYPNAPLIATITEIYIDPITSAGRVQWSRKSTGVEGYQAGTKITVPAGLIGKDSTGKVLTDQYLIYSEVSYVYTPVVGYVMRAAVTLSDSTFTRPRQQPCVYYQTATCPTS